MNPFNEDTYLFRNIKMFAFAATEASHNTLFHFIETVKVRGQARNIVTGDISHYFKNQVEKKPLISGIVSGFFGATAGAFAFYAQFQHLTHAFYANTYKDTFAFVDTIKLWDFRYKNILIYAVSDLTASIFKAPFEVRKQLIQMQTKELVPVELMKLS